MRAAGKWENCGFGQRARYSIRKLTRCLSGFLSLRQAFMGRSAAAVLSTWTQEQPCNTPPLPPSCSFAGCFFMTWNPYDSIDQIP